MTWDVPVRPELKQVTVLVTDLVNSTGLVAELDAEAAMNQLEPILHIMSAAVSRFGGTVVSTLGDGVMAVFGAPIAIEGHAVLACRAALAIRAALKGAGDGLSVRTGLHCGEIVAHAAPATRDELSTAFGVALHIASRLPAQIDPDVICLTESCYRLVRGYCDTTMLGRRALRGVPQPMLLYMLENMAAPTAARRPRGAELTPFIGRAAELDALKRCLEDALSGAGAVGCVTGVPGAGKSRLCFEFAEHCRAAGIPIFEARSQPFGDATPLKPVADLLRAAYFAIGPGESGEQSIHAVRRTLAAIDGSAPGDLALVCDLLDLPHEEKIRSFLSPASRRTRLIDIVGRLVRSHARSPMVLLLENLHWLDSSSGAFLTALARATAGTQTMLLLNTRAGEPHETLDLPGCRLIELVEFGKADTMRLLGHLLGPSANLDAIRGRVAEKSTGNPFFAEELVRSLAEDGVLAGRPGAYTRGRTPDKGTLPATVQGVIAARIDHLPRPERETLHLAAVIGKEFELPVLRDVAGAITGIEPGIFPAMVDGLCANSLLCRVGSSCRYAFYHTLTQDVAYSTQLKSRRTIVHAAVARALERVTLSSREEISGLIAFHLEEGGEGGEAAKFAARAARKIGQTDAVAAIKQWQKVRTLLAGQPRSAETDILRIEANGQLGWLGWRDGLSAAQARPYLEEALVWARETDAAMIPLLMLIEGRINQVSGGDADVFVAGVQQAIAIAERNGDVGRAATLRAQLSHAYGWAGLLREALAANDAALAGAAEVSAFDQQLLGYSVQHWAEALRGRILLRLGRIEPARRCFDATIALSGSLDPTVGFIAHFGYVELALHQGDGKLAAIHAGHIAALVEKHGSAYLRLYQLASKAYGSGAAGDLPHSIEDTRTALDVLRQTGVAAEFEPELLAHLAECLRRTSASEPAAQAAHRAIAIGLEKKSRLPHCRALITLAMIAHEQSTVVAGMSAAAALAAARGLIEETGALLYARRFNAACDRIDPSMRISEAAE